MRILILLCLLGVAGSVDVFAEDWHNCGLSNKIVSQFVPAGAVDVTCTAVPDGSGRYLASWTTRSKDSEPTSHLRLIRVKDWHATVLDKHRILGGYAAFWDYTAKFDHRHAPVWMLTAQYGGAQQDFWLVLLRRQSFRLVHTLGGTYLDSTPAGGGDSLLVAHDLLSGIDAPRLYMFRSGKFVDVSWAHPAYYRELMTKRGWSADGKNVNSTLYPQFARLVLLGGDKLGARKLIEAYRRAQSSAK